MRRLAYAVLAVIGIAGLWIWLHASHTQRAVDHESAQIHAPAAQPAPVEAASAPDSSRASESPGSPGRAARLRVRSSAGLPLAFVEVRGAAGWERVPVLEGSCDLGSRGLPLDVRAPGHLARALEAREGDLVLEPDALLVIQGTRLRSCLVDVGIEEEACARLEDWRSARERAVVSGWISDAAFGIAVAVDRREPLPLRLPVVAVRADRLRFYLDLEVRPGLRATWAMPCDGENACLPLEVHVDRLPGRRDPIQLVLVCSAPPGSAAVDGVPWGSVALSTLDLDERIVLGAEDELARFRWALVGRAHVLAALDESTRAYGRTSFVHDGRPRTLVLREALEIRGRVVEEQSRKPLRRVHLFMEGLGGPGWTVEAQNLELGTQGEFSLRAPSHAPALEAMQLDPPDRWTFSADQAGFDPREFLRFERAGAPILDVGEITLARHRNPIVLAPGHGLSPNEIDGHYVVFADRPEEAWPTVVGVALDDGRLEIECRRGKGDRAALAMMRANLLTGAEGFVAFERTLGSTLLVHVVDDVRSFRLESDGLYHRVPEDVLDVNLRTEALAGAGSSWKIGWTWDGAWIRVGQLASDVAGNEVHARITVPHGAQQLWWSSSGIPPDLHGDPGGFQAITGSSMKVVLR